MTKNISAHTHDKGSQNITGKVKFNAIKDSVQLFGIYNDNHGAFSQETPYGTDNRVLDSSLINSSQNQWNERWLTFNANNAGAWTGVKKYIYKFKICTNKCIYDTIAI